MNANHTKIVTQGFLRRHRSLCTVCHHPDREAIEEEYLHWHDVWKISRQYQIDDYRSIHRHARAYGLVAARRENMFAALDNIVEKSEGARVTGETIIRALRAYSCISDSGQWVEPPTRVVFSSDRPSLPAGATRRLLAAFTPQKTDPSTLDVTSARPRQPRPSASPAAKLQKRTAAQPSNYTRRHRTKKARS